MSSSRFGRGIPGRQRRPLIPRRGAEDPVLRRQMLYQSLRENALRPTSELKVGGSNPSERANRCTQRGRLGTSPSLPRCHRTHHLISRQKVTGQTCPPWLQDQHAIWYRSHGRVSGTSARAPARASSRSEAGRPDPPFQLHLELEGRPQARLPDAEKKQRTAAASCGSLDCAPLCNRGFAKVREDGLA